MEMLLTSGAWVKKKTVKNLWYFEVDTNLISAILKKDPYKNDDMW